MSNIVYIKNMVCPRCITAVESIFTELGIQFISIVLGEVILSHPLQENLKIDLKTKLLAQGFEVLEDHQSQLIGQIKTILIHQLHHRNDNLKVNFSTLLSDKLHVEYSVLSKLFSSVEGLTIERYILKQKIEKVKELLFYNQQTLSEIAFQMQYSSVAHLSAQFKRETGMTPTAFKKLKKPGHQSLDNF